MFVALKHRFLAVIAMALLGVIAVGLLRGDMDIDAAAIRAVVLVVAVGVIDRMVMPFVMLALASNTPKGARGVVKSSPAKPALDALKPK